MKKTAEDIFLLVKKEGGTRSRFTYHNTDDREVSVHNGEIEKTDVSRSISFALTVWVGDHVASVSGNDMSPGSLRSLVKQACDIAKMSEPDPFVMLAPRHLWPENPDLLTKQLDLLDTEVVPTMSDMLKWALEIDAENNKREKILTTDSEISYQKGTFAIFTSEGFEHFTEATFFYASCRCVAKQEDKKSFGSFGDGTRHFQDLLSFREIGKTAGDMAIGLLGAKPTKTGKMPIVLDRRVSRSLLSHLARALSGEDVYKKRTFLKESLGKQIFPSNVTIVDDPFIPRLLGSEASDSECVAGRKIEFVKDGILTAFATDMKSAAKLGTVSTGHASGFGNLYMENGEATPEELIASVKHGIYVIDCMGQGPNLVTGDYSRGVSGFLIEDGKITRPVNEITIAGNLSDMFMNLTVANDLDLGRYNVPALLIKEMMVAGEQS